MHKIRYVLLTFLIISILLGSIMKLYGIAPNEPHNANAMWIEPSTIHYYTDTVSIGYRFNVTVWINLTVVCGGWQFKLIYNKNYLNATRAGYTAGSKSDFFKNITTMPLSPSFCPYNSTHNYVLHGESWMMGDMRSPGYGSLAWIEFEIIAEPQAGDEITATLDIASSHHPPTSDTYALDQDGNEIPLTVQNCLYKFTSTETPPPPPPVGTTLYVEPSEIINSTMLPSSVFSINITILNVTDLKICQFNLTYNPNIIGWMSTRTFKVENQTPTAKLMVDDELGFIWMKLTYPVSVDALTPTPIVKIKFYVKALGATPLNLHDTELFNSENQPIEHTVKNGYFCTLIRDIAIVNITLERNWTYKGWPLNITVTLRNKGNVSETFTVATYYNQTLIGNLTVSNLPSGNETTITFVWNTENTTPCNNYTIAAKASVVPFEFNTVDNELTDGNVKIRYLGDVNGDDKVDVRDVYTVSDAFGSYPGNPRWNYAADVDPNLKIDVKDIFTVASHFGQGCL